MYSESGVDTITSYLVLALAIWIFQTYMINKNWRYTQVINDIILVVLTFVK